jgi:hypothetical protein
VVDFSRDCFSAWASERVGQLYLTSGYYQAHLDHPERLSNNWFLFMAQHQAKQSARHGVLQAATLVVPPVGSCRTASRRLTVSASVRSLSICSPLACILVVCCIVIANQAGCKIA